MSRATTGIRRAASDTGITPTAEQKTEQMRARAKAIDELLGRPDA
jgi:hypothetical protein